MCTHACVCMRMGVQLRVMYDLRGNVRAHYLGSLFKSEHLYLWLTIDQTVDNQTLYKPYIWSLGCNLTFSFLFAANNNECTETVIMWTNQMPSISEAKKKRRLLNRVWNGLRNATAHRGSNSFEWAYRCSVSVEREHVLLRGGNCPWVHLSPSPQTHCALLHLCMIWSATAPMCTVHYSCN